MGRNWVISQIISAGKSKPGPKLFINVKFTVCLADLSQSGLWTHTTFLLVCIACNHAWSTCRAVFAARRIFYGRPVGILLKFKDQLHKRVIVDRESPPVLFIEIDGFDET